MSLNSYDITKQSVVYGMFNQFVFNEVKTNIDLIERYFLMDASTMGNNLIKSLLDAIRKYEFSSIDEPLFRSILAGNGKTDAESASILQEIVRYKMYDTYQIDPIRKYIRGIGNQSLINKAMGACPNDPEGYVKYLKNHDYKADYSDVFSVTNFDEIDVNTIQANALGGWKSSFDFINQSYQPMQKYENGQICMVVAPPGCFTLDTEIFVSRKDCSEFNSFHISTLDQILKDKHNYNVLSYNEISKEFEKDELVDIWKTKEVTKLIEFKVSTGLMKYRCTPEHKFLTKNGWIPMSDINVGDSLIGYLGSPILESKCCINCSPTPVYDLEVKNNHNFILGNGSIAHNCGKTLFLITECLKMCIDGARCHYLALGDMNQKDFVQRMGAIYSGLTFGDTMLNLNNIYKQLRMSLGGRFSLTILPAAQTTVDEYIDYMISRINEFDVLFIDYDSNFKPNQSDNMYKEGGYIYDNLTKLTKLGKLVFVASQPKIGSWKNEVLEITDAGESSRKQHNTDIMITLSRGGMSYNPNHLGKMKIAKNRRGEEGIEASYIRLNNGRFRIIPESLYIKLKGIGEKRNYTDDEINQMISMEFQQNSQSQGVQMAPGNNVLQSALNINS